MVGSIWRYSHFLLAVVSAIFLLLASITGAILAFEPIQQAAQPYQTTDLNQVTLAQTVSALKGQYEEVLEVEIIPDDFVIASVFTEEGEAQTGYIDPISGNLLGPVEAQSPFFSFVTNLHRSLFLKGIGRAFVGIVSLLLCLIAVSGVFLLAQRQGGFTKWFSKVKERNISQRYHVVLGRWLLIPILLIAATGVYLSAEKFSLLPQANLTHTPLDYEALEDSSTQLQNDLFNDITLDEVRSLVFPFSEAPEDYYEISLQDRQQYVHQYTGEVLSEVSYPFVTLASRWSLQWHTGQGSILWSIVLCIASLSLLFFMFSGFSMSLKRLRNTSKTKLGQWSKDEAEYIILVGSETGNTFLFAKAFARALENAGKKTFSAGLNEYSSYQNAKHLIVFTATYGDGDAPNNARNFESILNELAPIQPIQCSVVGFGSRLYPHFCRFGIKVDELLQQHPEFTPSLPLHKIDDQSEEEFEQWVQKWNKRMGMNLEVSLSSKKRKKTKDLSFEVVECTPLNIDNTALIRLKPIKKVAFQSGDLLNIIPPEGSTPRSYSIAKTGSEILLSVKWHSQGKCSSYLCNLKQGDTLDGRIQQNSSFHLPTKSAAIWMIANGTGIAPYLGMLEEGKQIPKRLTWGGRHETSFDCYKDRIDTALHQQQLDNYQLAFSQANNHCYVQDLLQQQQTEVAQTLQDGGTFMLCGSLAMQESVLATLDEITTDQLQQPISHFEKNGQLLIDCY